MFTRFAVFSLLTAFTAVGAAQEVALLTSNFSDEASLGPIKFERVTQVSHLAKQDSDLLQLKEPDSSKKGSLLILSSDEPVDLPDFDSSEEQASPSDFKTLNENLDSNSDDTGYQLPPVASVRSPISLTPLTGIGQNDPSGLLVAGQTANTSSQYVDRSSQYSHFSGVPTYAKLATWKAHDFYHRPLYFEDQNLERYGNQRGLPQSRIGAIQNAASAVRFLNQTRTLPYQIGQRSPRSRVYTHGLPRPGDNVPYQSQIPTRLSPKGTALQTVVSLGIILP